MDHLLALGDSVVEGKNASSGREWVTLLAQELADSDEPLRVRNLARGGNTTRKLVAGLDATALPNAPRVLLLGIGVNDSRFRPSLNANEVPIGEFRSLVSVILGKLAATSPNRAILVGQAPVVDRLVDPFKPDKHYRREWQRPYEETLSEQAPAYGFTFVPVMDSWELDGEGAIESRMSDGLHPNDAGHLEISRMVGAALGPDV